MSETSAASGHDEVDSTVDDRFRALMEGLRTTIPGVQVLFAFLLTIPLSASFSSIGRDERISYYVAFAASGLASILLIAPSVHQRVRAPISGITRHSERHLDVAARLAYGGTIAAAVAIAAVAYFVTALLFGSVTASLVAAAVAGITTWSWFWLPLVSFGRDGAH